MYSKLKSFGQQRVELSEKILKKILEKVSSGRVSELAEDIVCRMVWYIILFTEESTLFQRKIIN